MTGVWKNSGLIPASYDTIFVAALTINLRAKNILEQQIADKLREKGVIVVRSAHIFPPNFTDYHNDKETVLGKIRKINTHGILTVSVIDVKGEIPLTPGGSDLVYYDSCRASFWSYYNYVYPRVYKPRYYMPEKTYFIEMNLYDMETEELIWSAQSKEYHPTELANFSKEFSQFAIIKLERDNLISARRAQENQKENPYDVPNEPELGARK